MTKNQEKKTGLGCSSISQELLLLVLLQEWIQVMRERKHREEGHKALQSVPCFCSIGLCILLFIYMLYANVMLMLANDPIVFFMNL